VPISHVNENDKNHAVIPGLDANKSTVIVSGSKDLTVRVWDFKSGHLLFELLGHTACVFEVALIRAKESPLAKPGQGIAPGTPIIVSCSEDTTVKLWNLTTGKLVKSLKWHSVNVRGIDVASVMLQPDSADPTAGTSLIASCGWDKTIQFHELGEALYAKKESFCSIM
jgi:WD40 repeat protein